MRTRKPTQKIQAYRSQYLVRKPQLKKTVQQTIDQKNNQQISKGPQTPFFRAAKKAGQNGLEWTNSRNFGSPTQLMARELELFADRFLANSSSPQASPLKSDDDSRTSFSESVTENTSEFSSDPLGDSSELNSDTSSEFSEENVDAYFRDGINFKLFDNDSI